MPRTLNLAAMCDWLLFGSGGIAFASAELHITTPSEIGYLGPRRIRRPHQRRSL
jgi:hypothetical protein